MKKLVSVLLALLLVGSFAFAEVAVGSWSRIIFVPAASTSLDDAETGAITGPSWAKGARVGLGFSASTDQAGMKLDVHANGTVLEIGDQAKIWVQPFPMLKIQAGKVQEDKLRGKFDDSNIINGLGNANFTGLPGKDTYFTRFYPKFGVVVSSEPTEGLFLAAALDAAQTVPATISADLDMDGTVTEDEKLLTGGETVINARLTEDMFKTIQIGGGYEIPGVGLARAQYRGGLEKAAAWIEAAFAYTAMEGVLVDAGTKINVGESKTGQNSVAVAGSYTMDALYALVRTYVGFGEDATSDKLEMKFSTDLSYKVAEPFSLGVEAAYSKRDKPVIIDVLPYVQVASGAGKLKTGFLFESKNKEAGDYTSWAIPIMVEVGF